MIYPLMGVGVSQGTSLIMVTELLTRERQPAVLEGTRDSTGARACSLSCQDLPLCSLPPALLLMPHVPCTLKARDTPWGQTLIPQRPSRFHRAASTERAHAIKYRAQALGCTFSGPDLLQSRILWDKRPLCKMEESVFSRRGKNCSRAGKS